VVDAGSTYHALTASNMVEANPALAWIGDPLLLAAGSIGLKHVSKHVVTGLGAPACQANRVVESAGWLGGGWNTALISGAATGGAALVGAAAAGSYIVLTRSRCPSEPDVEPASEGSGLLLAEAGIPADAVEFRPLASPST
jgi:hypothetical protein